MRISLLCAALVVALLASCEKPKTKEVSQDVKKEIVFKETPTPEVVEPESQDSVIFEELSKKEKRKLKRELKKEVRKLEKEVKKAEKELSN